MAQSLCPNTRPAAECSFVWLPGHLSFFFFGPLEIVWTFGVGYLASLFWPAPRPAQVMGMTIWTRRAAEQPLEAINRPITAADGRWVDGRWESMGKRVLTRRLAEQGRVARRQGGRAREAAPTSLPYERDATFSGVPYRLL